MILLLAALLAGSAASGAAQAVRAPAAAAGPASALGLPSAPSAAAAAKCYTVAWKPLITSASRLGTGEWGALISQRCGWGDPDAQAHQLLCNHARARGRSASRNARLFAWPVDRQHLNTTTPILSHPQRQEDHGRGAGGVPARAGAPLAADARLPVARKQLPRPHGESLRGQRVRCGAAAALKYNKRTPPGCLAAYACAPR